MRVVVLQDDRTLAIEEAPQAALGATDVRIDIAACGICGSDLHLKTTEAVRPGAVFGHEFSGVITEVGGDVEELTVGDHVACWPSTPCGECAACEGGNEHLCAVSLHVSPGLGKTPGAFAESIVLAARHVVRVPREVPLEHIALAEPLAVAVHAVNLAAIAPGAAIAISGGGPIGIMTALALRAKGHRNVVVIEPNPQRRDRLATVGISAVPIAAGRQQGELVADAVGARPSVVFECAGHEASLPACIRLVAPGGTVVVEGVLHEPVTISQMQVTTKELRILGSFCHSLDDFKEATALLVDGVIPAADIITGVAPLDRAEELFAELGSGGSEHVKVLLRP